MKSFLRAATKAPVSRALLTTQRQQVIKPMLLAHQQPSMVRFYGAGPPPLTREFVQERIVDLLKCFDKIEDPEKITPQANFNTDLKLDSLDVVECLFFIEEEFGIQMPDQEADEIKTVGQAVDYILAQPDAF